MNGFEIQCLPGADLPVMEIFGLTSGMTDPEEWFFDVIAGERTDTGIRVNPSKAIAHGPVWQALNILSGDVGQLPIHVMRERGRKKEKFKEHPVDWLLNGSPNEQQTPSTWKETMMLWCASWGNGCSYIERDGSGRPSELIPLLPDRTWAEEVAFDSDEQKLRVRFMVICTLIEGKVYPLLYEDVFHLPWLATDGFWGISPVQACKNTIAHGMALEKHGNKLFSNGARPSGVLEHPNTLSVDARANLRKEWYAIHGGLDNAAKIAILMEGMKFTPMSMSSKDAEWMADRKFDRESVASIFNLPAYKLNALENSSVRANLEQQNRDYFDNSLSRHLNKFREELDRKMLTYGERRWTKQRGQVYSRWFPEAFLRGDTLARFQAYGVAITHRIMNPNEAREKEDWNPYDGGDEFLNPAIEQTQKTKGDKESDPTNDQQKTLARRLVAKQVAALLETEAKCLEKSVSASPPRNFCKWAANYYEGYPKMATNFLEVPAEVAINSGFAHCHWLNAIELHAQDGLQAVLVLAEQVTQIGLSKVINDRAAEVRSMADKLTASILGEN